MSQHINLYDPALERKRDWFALTNVAAAALVLSVLVVAAGVVARNDVPALSAQVASGDTQLKTMRDQMTALGQQVASLKPDPRLEQEIGAARLLLSSRGEVLNFLKQRLGPDSLSFAEHLRGLARQSMNGLWLTRFDIQSGAGRMEIHGRMTDPALLPEYIRRLNKEPVFQGQAFSALKLGEGKAAVEKVAAATTPAKAPFHEFMLIPKKAASATGAAGADKPALASQSQPSGGHG